MSSTFARQAAATPAAAPLDPRKHVNYTMGMVLGVDDFNQEFAYQSGHIQWLARDLLGYGTVSGLEVSVEHDGNDPRIFVDAGVALSPRGQLIHIPVRQCAHLNTWLASQQHQLHALSLKSAQSGSAQLTLYVVLSYRERPTDGIPLPTDVSRAAQATTAASRLSDDFELDIRATAPDQREETALRTFVSWLRQVQLVDVATSPSAHIASLESFATALRTAAHLPASLATLPTNTAATTPLSRLLIPVDQAANYWRTAFHIWTTEVRPFWQATASDGSVGIPDEPAILLARLNMAISASAQGQWTVATPASHQGRKGKGHSAVAAAQSIVLDDSDRPYLLSLRLLQEWMHSGRRETPPSDAVTDATNFGQAATAGTSATYSRADHTHGTPSLSSLSGDVVATDDGTVTVQGLRSLPLSAQTPEDGQVLVFNGDQQEWQAANPPTISATEPQDGQVLMYNAAAGQWQAADLPEAEEEEEDVEEVVEAENNAVMHPEGAGQYLIVAAGLVRCDGSSEHATYNGLVAHAQTHQGRPTGLVLLHFRGYEKPKRFPYIVKALPQWREKNKSIIVQFENFAQHGITLRLTDGSGANIHHEQLRQIELMLEISQYA